MKTLDPARLRRRLTDRFEADHAAGRAVGASILVSQHGQIVCRLCLGEADAETGEPVRPRALFRLASMTKPVTGAACLIGLQNGWFRLDDRVGDHLPELAELYVARLENGAVVPDHRAKNELRVYQLLSHCSGLLAEDELGAQMEQELPPSAYASAAAMLRCCAEHPSLCFEPGTRTAYSGGAAFDAVGRILEKYSGLPYDEFVQRCIFTPLGLRDLTFRPTQEQWSRMAGMHDRTEGGGVAAVRMGAHTYEGYPLDYACAGTSLAGTAEDYWVFAEMLRRNGEYGGVRIFAPELLAALKTPYVPDGTPGRDPCDSWGLGVRVCVHNPVLPAGSFGWSGAYGTHFWVDQENGITALYLRNSRWYDSHGCGRTGRNFEWDVMSCLA